jgi:D-arabinose 1-dehydrogenase-like Zn-dependent alcohol dehydrogenase
LRAMAVTEYGAPLERIDVDEPELVSGHALVQVLTCSVCFSDVKTSRGKMPYSDTLRLPHVPGHEICARVLGTDPPGALEPGTLVVVYHIWPCRVCARCRAGQDNLCRAPVGWAGFTQPGGFQDKLLVPLDRVVAVPQGIEPVHAAPMTCALGTAFRATITRGRTAPATRVVVVGLGGVGIHAVQIARCAGAEVVGLDVSDDAISATRDLGIEARRADDPATVERIIAETGEGVDVVVDTVGHEASISSSYAMTRPGGRIVAVGYSLTESFMIHSARFVLDEVELVGSRYVRMHELERAIRLVAEGKVQTVIDRVLPLENVNDAFEALENGKVVGRVVLDVAGVA